MWVSIQYILSCGSLFHLANCKGDGKSKAQKHTHTHSCTSTYMLLEDGWPPSASNTFSTSAFQQLAMGNFALEHEVLQLQAERSKTCECWAYQAKFIHGLCLPSQFRWFFNIFSRVSMTCSQPHFPAWLPLKHRYRARSLRGAVALLFHWPGQCSGRVVTRNDLRRDPETLGSEVPRWRFWITIPTPHWGMPGCLRSCEIRSCCSKF